MFRNSKRFDKCVHCELLYINYVIKIETIQSPIIQIETLNVNMQKYNVPACAITLGKRVKRATENSVTHKLTLAA